MTHWAIITGEYPPLPGGVSDYTYQVARGLVACGDTVHVFTVGHDPNSLPAGSGITVTRLPGRFGLCSLNALERLMVMRPQPERILVQYVPQAFGWKGMNLPFAVWLATRAWRIAPVDVMLHEVVFPFSWRPMKHAVLGAGTRTMARLVGRAADRVFVSIPAWGNLLKRICPRVKPPMWLPVPCTLDANPTPDAVATARVKFAARGVLVGHFGTFGAGVVALLTPLLVDLLVRTPAVVVLVGRGSMLFTEQFITNHPEHRGRIVATGELSADAVSAHLRACDLLVQPFPDGVSSRRTSVMAGLANGVATVTNLGALSEPLWANGAVAVVASPDPIALAHLTGELLLDPTRREKLGNRGLALYRDLFAIEHTIAKLRGTA